MALPRAAFLGERRWVIQLLRAGADPNSQDQYGQSAFTLALEGAHRDEEGSWGGGHEHFEIVQDLLASGHTSMGPETRGCWRMPSG
jgi:ankyrin repeat protein